MTSLQCCARPPQLIHEFHRPSFRPHSNTNIFFNPNPSNALLPHFSFRFENAGRLEVRQRSVRVYSSNTNPSEGSDVAKSSDNDNAKGPPFLTILAGFFVLFGICWIIGSIAMWLIGLIINPQSK